MYTNIRRKGWKHSADLSERFKDIECLQERFVPKNVSLRMESLQSCRYINDIQLLNYGRTSRASLQYWYKRFFDTLRKAEARVAGGQIFLRGRGGM